MTPTATSADLDILLPLMHETGVTVPPHEFHSTVNLLYHASEAKHYDQLHASLLRCLPQQFHLLIGDLIEERLVPRQALRILDLGCGTGHSAELLLGCLQLRMILQLDLLDTSPEMLERSSRRECFRGTPLRLLQGEITGVVDEDPYHLILACSVLHHLPSLEDLAAALHRLQRPGGLFVHLQDPNGDALHNPRLAYRRAELQRDPRFRLCRGLSRWTPTRVARRLYRVLTASAPETDLRRVNDELLGTGTIRRPLSEGELWRITDLRVHDGKGISIDVMRSLLRGYRLVALRSYSFFGELSSELPRRYQRQEQHLIRQRSLDGMHIAAAWVRTEDAA